MSSFSRNRDFRSLETSSQSSLNFHFFNSWFYSFMIRLVTYLLSIIFVIEFGTFICYFLLSYRNQILLNLFPLFSLCNRIRFNLSPAFQYSIRSKLELHKMNSVSKSSKFWRQIKIKINLFTNLNHQTFICY